MLNSYKSKPDHNAAGDIARHVDATFREFYDARMPYEEKALEWWTNFISQYNPTKNMRVKEGERSSGKIGRSRVFVKLTQLKCYTAHAKVMDAIGVDLPLLMEPLSTLMPVVREEELTRICDVRRQTLLDYSKHIKFLDVLDDVVLSSTIFPCGVMKGPLLKRNRVLRYLPRMIGGVPAIHYGVNPYEMVEDEEDVFTFEEVPWWDFYTDTNAKSPAESIAEIQYARLHRSKFRALRTLPGYHPTLMKEAIENIDTLETCSEDERDKLLQQLNEHFFVGKMPIKDNKIPMVEYQGLMNAGLLRKMNSWVPENINDDEDVEAIVNVAGTGTVVRAQYNVMGARQFMTMKWRKYPSSVYGIGPAGLMDDSQSVINSSVRMFLDNKALSGNGMVAVNPDKMNLAKTGDMSVYPRKIWYLRGAATPQEAISSITFPDVGYGLREVIELFLQFADEETSVPKVAGGEQAGSFLNKTAAGMSMLLGQQNLNLKPVLKNIDDSILEPAMERLDRVLSMTGLYPQEINIPLKVNAVGTMSLMAREIIVENLMRLMSVINNPQDAVLVDRRRLIREIADKMSLTRFVRSDAEIVKIEQMLAEQQKSQPIENKGRVDIDKLYPLLSRNEQMQVLQSIGIQPDSSFPGFTPDKKGIMPAQQLPEQGGMMPEDDMPMSGGMEGMI